MHDERGYHARALALHLERSRWSCMRTKINRRMKAKGFERRPSFCKEELRPAYRLAWCGKCICFVCYRGVLLSYLLWKLVDSNSVPKLGDVFTGDHASAAVWREFFLKTGCYIIFKYNSVQNICILLCVTVFNISTYYLVFYLYFLPDE